MNKISPRDPSQRPIHVRRKGQKTKSLIKFILFCALCYGVYHAYLHYEKQSQKNIRALLADFQSNLDRGNEFIIKEKATAADLDVLSQYSTAEKPEMRVLVAECVGKFPTEKSFSLLSKFLEDKEPTVRRAAIGALQNFRQVETIDILIARIQKEEDADVKGDLGRSLRELTGEGGKSTNADYWQSWWKNNRKSFRFP